MSIFDSFRRDRYPEDYDDSDDTYDDDFYDYDDDDDDEDEGVSRFAQGYSATAQEPPKQTHSAPRQAPKPNYTAPKSSQNSSSYGSSSAYGSSSSYKNTSSRSSSSYSGYSAPKAADTSSATFGRSKVEELYIADLSSTSDALSVADLVKEKRFALIVNLNPLRADGSTAAYSSVINFIDGVCYVTDSEFKEINKDSGMFLIYHKDIVLNEGLGGYYNPDSYKL